MARRLIIADGSSGVSTSLLRKLEGWTVYGTSEVPDTARGSHSLVVLDTIRSAVSGPVELYMVPAFDVRGNRTDHRSLIRTIETAAKGDAVVNLSWGVSMRQAGLTARYRMIQEVADWRAFQARNPGVMLVWAAGNTGDLLPDDDAEYPQASLQSETSVSVGALEGGRPTAYSSDSTLAPMLAMDAAWTFEGHAYTGTSFAAPKASAVFLERGWRRCSEALQYAVPVPGGERKGLYTLDHQFKALLSRKVS